MHVKDSESLKDQSPHHWELLSPTLLLKCLKGLLSGPTFNSVTLWHHTDRADLRQGAGSGVRELTNQSRFGISGGELKETGAKTEHVRQRGNTEQVIMKKTDAFLIIKACGLNLAVTSWYVSFKEDLQCFARLASEQYVTCRMMACYVCACHSGTERRPNYSHPRQYYINVRKSCSKQAIWFRFKWALAAAASGFDGQSGVWFSLDCLDTDPLPHLQ